jgi:hypothetical protein
MSVMMSEEAMLSDEEMSVGSYNVEDPGDRQISEVLTESCWLYYCIFSGCGFAPCSKCCDPCILSTYKCLCCEGYTGTAPCYSEEEGCCMTFNKFCCCVTAGSFPPGGSKGDGLPCVACCNYRCGGEDDIRDLEHVPSEAKLMLDKTFMLYYCCCAGAGCLRGAPMCKGTGKFCCIHGNYETAECCGDKGCCYQKIKLCCCVSAAACPPGGGPRDGIPVCALCSYHCGGGEDEYDYEEEDAPEQEMM